MRTTISSESLPLGTERFSTNKEVIKSLATINDAAAMLSEDMQSLTKEYDGLVAYSYVPGEYIAVPVGHADADNVDPRRHDFRNENILNRAVLLRNTGLSHILNDPKHPFMHQSEINQESPQMTYTRPLIHDDAQVGAIQHSFTPENNKTYLENLPEEQALAAVWNRNQAETSAIAAEVAHLQLLSRELGSLAACLEYEDPVAPNAFIIRWDIEGSKRVAASEQRRLLKAYINQAHRRIRSIANEYHGEYGDQQFAVEQVYDDQGDGANIILPIPRKWDTYNKSVLDSYRHYTADPFMHEVTQALETMGAQYQDLAPTVRVDGAFGYFEPNSIGRFISSEMFRLGAQKHI